MSHKCNIEGSSAACFEIRNELWVKEFADGPKAEGRTYKVKFCPECGYQILEKRFTKGFFDFLHLPYAQVDDSISKFSMELGRAISEMNHNIALIKGYMSSQNVQNQCFMDNEMDIRKELRNLKKMVEAKDDEIPF